MILHWISGSGFSVADKAESSIIYTVYIYMIIYVIYTSVLQHISIRMRYDSLWAICGSLFLDVCTSSRAAVGPMSPNLTRYNESSL